MLIDLYNNMIYLPPDPDDETKEKVEEKHEDCLPPREECHVMGDDVNEAIILYLEQETVIPANTMRIFKVTNRNLHKHEADYYCSGP